jgi:hypothetical protein
MNLCKYKNIFGELGTGVHSIRIFNIAVFDVLGTIIISILIHYLLLKLFNYYIDLYIILIICFCLGILLHRLFCVRTTIDKLLFKK